MAANAAYKRSRFERNTKPSFRDFPLWLKAIEQLSFVIVALALVAYFAPDQNLLPEWTLIPKYPVPIGILFFLVADIRPYLFLKRLRAYGASMKQEEGNDT